MCLRSGVAPRPDPAILPCPEDAIRMDTGQVEMSAYSRRDMIWTLPKLMGDKKKSVSFQSSKDPLA